jgi:hypothetical protein
MAQQCRNPNVVGYYIDDGWAADAANNPHGPSEVDGNWKADMVSKTELNFIPPLSTFIFDRNDDRKDSDIDGFTKTGSGQSSEKGEHGFWQGLTDEEVTDEIAAFRWVRKTHLHLLRCHFVLKTIILPRQARDKHTERVLKNGTFSQVADRAYAAMLKAGKFNWNQFL